MSVLMLGINYSPETTGIAPYTAGLAVELADRDNRVRVVTSFPHYPQWAFHGGRPARSQQVDQDGVRVVRRRHRLPRKPGGLTRAISELSFGWASVTTRAGRPDVVILVSPALLASAVALVKFRLVHRRPVVVWVQDLYSLGLRELGGAPSGVAARAMAALEGWTLRSADAVVVIHERFRDTVVQELGVRPESVTVVRNWSHMTEAPGVDREAARAALGWKATDFVVLHAGNMGVKQGLENVVEAARLARPDSGIRFVLLGDGNQREHLAALGASVPGLTILGSLPDAEFVRVLNSADALLVNEKGGVAGMAVPSKLTSYFSTGLPVIAATEPGSITESEVVLAGAGLVVRPDDPSALLAAAAQLARDRSAASAHGKNGRQFRIDRLTPRASFDTFSHLLEGLASRRHTSAAKESGTI